MKRYFCILTVLLALLSAGARAQRVPDNDSIFRAVVDGASPYYYPNLMARYMAGDATLSPDDYFYLYYGYIWEPTYRPLEPDPDADHILELFSKNPEPGYSQCESIIGSGLKVMRRDPFSPRNLNYLTYAYGALGDTLNERLSARRFEAVLATIRSSGTGLKDSSPWHVLTRFHAEDVVGAMGLVPRRALIISAKVEYIPLLEPNDGVKGYYFDYSRAYSKKPDNLPDKRSGGWRINGLKVK